MTSVILKKEVTAQQYMPGTGAPVGCVRSHMEVHWSADRTLVYFSFGRLRPRHWLGVEKLSLDHKAQGFAEVGRFKALGTDEWSYCREVLPFAFWSVKSEASVTRNWTPVFLDESDDQMVVLAKDYVAMSGWVKAPGDEMIFSDTVEFRETDGKYASGYRPHYLSPGDWLTSEMVDGRRVYRVLTSQEFERLRAA